jgi:hypothetical protein
MSHREGFRRVRLIGKAILATGLLLDGFLIIGLIVAGLARGLGDASPFFAIGFFGIPVTIVGIAILCAAWIVEGFLLHPRPPHTPDRPSGLQ